MTLNEKLAIAKAWIYEGKFTINGVTYKRGVNTYSACQILKSLLTIPVSELAHHYNELMTIETGRTGIPPTGFTIGNSSALYWYVTPTTKNGKYRLISIRLDSTMSVPPDKMVTIHFQ
jgi:hypothetical protein